MPNCTHLEPAQTLTKFLAELHVQFPLTHDVLAKLLSCETILRKERFLLGTPFRCHLDSCRLRPVSSLAQSFDSVDRRVQPFAQGALQERMFLVVSSHVRRWGKRRG
jgi:hypothetical protein